MKRWLVGAVVVALGVAWFLLRPQPGAEQPEELRLGGFDESARGDEATHGDEAAGTSTSRVEDSRARQAEAARAELTRVIKRDGADSLAAAEAHDALVEALYYAGQGAAPETRQAAERALELKEQLLEPNAPSLAVSLENLGAVLNAAGRYGRATDALERSLAIKSHHGAAPLGLAIGHLNLGELCRQTGRFDDAKAHFDRALTHLDAASGEQTAHARAMAHNNYGLLLHNMGDFLEAAPHFEAAHTHWLKASDAERSTALVLNNIGRLLHDLGDFSGARQRFEAALDIWNSMASPNEAEKASALNNLGYLYHDARKLNRARSLYDAALKIREPLLGRQHRAVAWTLSNQALLELEAGDLDRAARLFERALAIRREALGDEHKLVFHSLTYLATVELARGNLHTAFRHALEAERRRRQGLVSTLPFLPERQALEMQAVYLQVFGLDATSLDVLLSLLADHHAELSPSDVAAASDALVRSRGLVFDAMLQRRGTLDAMKQSAAPGAWDAKSGAGAEVEPTRSQLLAELAAARQALANCWVQGLETTAARRRKERAEAALVELGFGASDKTDASRFEIDWEAIRAALVRAPANSALVSFVRYQKLERRSGKPRAIPSYLALVGEGARAGPRCVDLGRADAIDVLVKRWRGVVARLHRLEGLSSRESAAERRRAREELGALGDDLRRRTWDPAMRQCEQPPSFVFLVPDASLCFVSFAALPNATDADRFVLESGPTIHYLAAAKDLATRPSARKGDHARRRSDEDGGDTDAMGTGTPESDEFHLVALGHPTYGPYGESALGDNAASPRSDCVRMADVRFRALPGTESEARAISALLQRDTSVTRGVKPPRVSLLLGSKATEAAVKEMAPRATVLHLATHGFYLDAVCDQESRRPQRVSGDLDLRRVAPLVGRSRRPQAASPLLLSGLACAGANRRTSAAAAVSTAAVDDGILTAEEVAALDLQRVEWAVLSACSTGIGEVRSGEGVFGLRRAFFSAGARTLITSLWPVQDAATQEWMAELYRARFDDRLGAAHSVREASLRVLQRRRERGASDAPFYWAGFVGAGDWE